MLVQDLLASERISGTISELRYPKTRLQNFYGVNMGGINEVTANDGQGGKTTSYDIFNTTREIAALKGGITPPHQTQPDPLKKVTFTLLRAYEARMLNYDLIWNRRAIGQSPGTVDKGGVDYMRRQEMNLGQTFVNLREFALAMMFRGEMGILQGTDYQIPTTPGDGTYDIDYGVAADHKGQAGGIIAAPWSAADTKIVDHILALHAKSEEDTGYELMHAWCNSATWKYILNNTQIQTLGGSSDVSWVRYSRVVDRGPENEPVNEWVAELKAIPGLQWHITDYGLNVSDGTTSTFTKMFPNDYVLFTPEPSGDWIEHHKGSEVVKDNDLAPAAERFGFYPYAYEKSHPAAVNLVMLDNFLPVLRVPNAIFWLKVANYSG